MSDINEFLDTIHQQLGSTEKHKVIITGNDSADLDSIISSLLFAYLSHCFRKDDSLYIPIVKVPKSDLELRPELKFVLEQVQVDYKKLICIDDLQSQTPTDIVLIDHNHLTKPFDTKEWSDKVVGVLDHHVDEHLYMNAPIRNISMVGSCVSLVLDYFISQYKHDWINPTIAKLSMAPLLVDTINLKWELGRTTEKDIEIFDILKQQFMTQEDTFTAYFQSIEKVKSKVDTMENLDILRRDYKQFEVNGFTIGTSSVTWNLRAWAERENGSQGIIDSAKVYIDKNQLDMEAIITAFDHDPDQLRGGDYRRELALIINNPKLLVIKQEIEKNTTINLSPIKELNPDSLDNIEFYDQGNIKMSRKQVWPLIKQLIETYCPQ